MSELYPWLVPTYHKISQTFSEGLGHHALLIKADQGLGAEGLARARGRGELDRIEQQGLDFFHRTRQRYLELVQNNPKVAIINAGQPLEQVQVDIQSAVKNWWVSQVK